jgi:hypothetical protein
MIAYADGAEKMAKDKGLVLVKLLVDGRYAKKGRIEISAPVGPETAEKLSDLCVLLANAKERMK